MFKHYLSSIAQSTVDIIFINHVYNMRNKHKRNKFYIEQSQLK